MAVKTVLRIVVTLYLLKAGIAHSMHGDQPASPPLRSRGLGAGEVCDSLQALAVFVGCCIYDVPSYIEKVFSDPECEFRHTDEKMPLSASDSKWNSHVQRSSAPMVLRPASIGMRSKKD
jgi:hypothetical protein